MSSTEETQRTVWLDGDELVRIESATCAVPAVVESARTYARAIGSPDDLAGWLARQLELASRIEALAAPALDLSSHKEAIAELKQHYTKGTQWFESQLADKVRATIGTGGILPSAIDGALQRLETTVSELTASESSPIHRTIAELLERNRAELLALVQASTASQVVELQRLLAPSNAASPLHTFLDLQLRANGQLEQTVNGLAGSMSSINAALAAYQVRQATPLKGGPHETDLGVVLARVAHIMGADHEATGRKSGATGSSSWVGDHTVTWSHDQGLARSPRVVVEAKNTMLSANAWRKEARAAMDNRQADAFLGVAADSSQVPGGGLVALVDENLIVVAFDPVHDDESLLVATLRLLHGQASIALRAAVPGADLQVVSSALARARAHLDRFGEASRKLVSIRHSADSLGSILDEIRSGLENELAKAVTGLSDTEVTQAEMPSAFLGAVSGIVEIDPIAEDDSWIDSI